MTRGSSLRRAAAQFSISTSTAFRWRHRLCGELATRRCPLSDIVEVTLLYVPESRKGDRVLHRAPRRRGFDPASVLREAVCIVIAADRTGGVLSGCLPRRHPEPEDLAELLEPHLDGPLTVVAADGPLGAISRYVRRRGGVMLDARTGALTGAVEPLLRVRSYVRRLTSWMRQFRGVATKYLDHYLAWHRWLDIAGRPDFEGLLLRWPQPGAG